MTGHRTSRKACVVKTPRFPPPPIAADWCFSTCSLVGVRPFLLSAPVMPATGVHAAQGDNLDVLIGHKGPQVGRAAPAKTDATQCDAAGGRGPGGRNIAVFADSFCAARTGRAPRGGKSPLERGGAWHAKGVRLLAAGVARVTATRCRTTGRSRGRETAAESCP